MSDFESSLGEARQHRTLYLAKIREANDAAIESYVAARSNIGDVIKSAQRVAKMAIDAGLEPNVVLSESIVVSPAKQTRFWFKPVVLKNVGSYPGWRLQNYVAGDGPSVRDGSYHDVPSINLLADGRVVYGNEVSFSNTYNNELKETDPSPKISEPDDAIKYANLARNMDEKSLQLSSMLARFVVSNLE